jgi:hypothetical protein
MVAEPLTCRISSSLAAAAVTWPPSRPAARSRGADSSRSREPDEHQCSSGGARTLPVGPRTLLGIQRLCCRLVNDRENDRPEAGLGSPRRGQLEAAALVIPARRGPPREPLLRSRLSTATAEVALHPGAGFDILMCNLLSAGGIRKDGASSHCSRRKCPEGPRIQSAAGTCSGR